MTESQFPAQLDCAGKILDLAQPNIMGVLNVTPDSFSDGAQYYRGGTLDIGVALARAEQMVADGAAIIDVGGESTRPGAEPVTEQQEIDRVAPVIDALSARIPAVISVDTSNPGVMRAAVAAGAGLVNDVRALSKDLALETLVQLEVPVCLMHMQGQPGTMQLAPGYENVVAEVHDFLQARVRTCVRAGIPQHKIIVDPGFGFGKTLQHNLELLKGLAAFKHLGIAVAVGISRKSMLGQLTGRGVNDRLYAGLAAATVAILNGARIIRCHDVAETLDAVKVAAAVV